MSGEVRSYRDLIVWQRSMELVTEVYRLVRAFPKYETYGLSDQMRRASVSIPSNIAEGQARQHTAEFRQFLYIALASTAELDTQLIIAQRLNYVTSEDVAVADQQVIEVKKMLNSLITRLGRTTH